MSPTTRTFVLALLFGALLVPAAEASTTQSSIMMDDDLLVYRGDSTASRSLEEMKALGVDTVRVTVLWRSVAPSKKPRRLSKPSSYPVGNWDRYDNLVRSAQALGIRVYFNLTGPGPKWAHGRAPSKSLRKLGTYKPKPALFKQFVTAVGRRFSGNYTDENGCRCVLPRVRMWSLWNEPNQAGWLSPQWESVGGTRVPVAAQLYRKLHQSGYRGLAASGHRVGKDIVLLAETAPLGSSKRGPKSPLFPAVFLRELACIKSNNRKYTGKAARLRRCRPFGGKLRASGYAHHPYTKNVPTTKRHPNRNAITMANISALGKLLDRLSSRTGRKIPRKLPLWMTEFGFETNPPDPFNGVSQANQVIYNTRGEFIAYQNRRIAAQSQFLLRDVPPVAGRNPASKAYWFTYQSGLYLADGTAKPAAGAYALPFLARRAGSSFKLWGQLRFIPDGQPASAVIQAKPRGAPESAWTTIGAPIGISRRGYFTAQRAAPFAGSIEWRGAWLKSDGTIGAASLPSVGA